TAVGDLKVLVVFAKFKDDNNPHQFWPADSYPTEMNNFIDTEMQNGSAHFLNLTNYYSQMSFGNFKLTGKTIGAETLYPASHYIPANGTYPDRSLANKDILQVIDDSVDYRDFDNWTYLSDYYHSNEPDGIVDMVIIIWRGLVLTDNWSGEASLGRGPEFLVENNQITIKMHFGGNTGNGIYGSGVTIQYWGEKTRERNFKNTIHEVAHWLIHGEHPYSEVNHTFWGMLTPGNEGICANAFERERVAWINPILIESTILSAPMGDYITTPSAYKYHPGNGNQNEMFYFENHQQLSIYDNGTSNVNDKGIFILHFQHGYYMGDCVRIISSDGFWNWESPYSENCWGNNISALQKEGVNRNGFGNRDRMTSNSFSEFLYSYINNYNQVECNDWLHGYGFNNAFNTTFNDVFSSWSNPPAKTWNGQSTDFIMEVINQSGAIVTARFAIQNSIGGKPSKPPLGWDPGMPDSLYQSGWVYLAWGSDFWDVNPIEPDVNWSELQRKIGSGSWNTIYSGPNRYWSDGTINYDPTGIYPIYFRVRVRDSQNIWSIGSDLFDIKMMNGILTSIESLSEDNQDTNPSDFDLSQNYPNPFNPATTITYRVPVEANVTLDVFNTVGEQVAKLVNEGKPAGSYEVQFDGTSLSSGVYFYRLQAGNYMETKKMIFLK
ncbi:MAG: T9SS type A sorting domain-containing protein, partial [Ignavibacteriaceae bacterium]